ncbi:hypothetical protein ABBQ38_012915 [Trebouxia sp. C0009 RCD-2024]
MNKVNITLFFAALLVIGACAEPRKLLASSEGAHLADASEHQRILAELEEVHQLRERMLQEGMSCSAYSMHNMCDSCQQCQSKSRTIDESKGVSPV